VLKSRFRIRLLLMKLFVVFLSVSRQLPGWNLEVGLTVHERACALALTVVKLETCI
jgi:hypothetical protein